MVVKNYDLWCSFWKLLPEMKEKVKAMSSRSGISDDAAIFLVFLSDYKDVTLPINEKLIDELANKGYVLNDANGLHLTSRGEILGKAFKKQIFGI